MAITVKTLNEMFNKDVFTNKGSYVGRVKDIELDLSRFRIRSIVIEAARGTFLGQILGGKKGLIVPYQLVQAVDDIVIIKHITAAVPGEGEVSAQQIETE